MPDDAARSLDFAILCARYREGPQAFGFDPRTSPETVARALEVSAATVRRRFTEWKRRGFFRGYDVLPHPQLLGGRLVARLLEFSDAVAQDRAVHALAWMDGVIQIIPSREFLMVVYVVESAGQSARRGTQLRQLAGVKEFGAELPFPWSGGARRMSRSDWRFVQALRRTPEARLASLAQELGQSPRTASRRLDGLLRSGAIVFDPILDYTRFPRTLAAVIAYLDGPDRAESIGGQIGRLFPDSLAAGGPSPVDAEGRPRTVQFLVCARNAAEVDATAARAAHLDGVQRVLVWYERSSLPVRAWLDERIDALLASYGAG